MLDLFLNYLKKDGLTAVLYTHVSEYRDMQCLEVKYVKDNDYFHAKSFSNGIWLSPYINGCECSRIGLMVQDDIDDVCSTTKCESIAELKALQFINNEDLKQMYLNLEQSLKGKISNILKLDQNLIYKCRLVVNPKVGVEIVLISDGLNIGTLVLYDNDSIGVLNVNDSTRDVFDNVVKAIMNRGVKFLIG